MATLTNFSLLVIFIARTLSYINYAVLDPISEKKGLINIHLFSVLLRVFVNNYDALKMFDLKCNCCVYCVVSISIQQLFFSKKNNFFLPLFIITERHPLNDCLHIKTPLTLCMLVIFVYVLCV